MTNCERNSGARPWPTAAVVLLLALPLAAGAHKSEAWARSQFAAAEHLHQELEARSPQELSRTDYQRVINAYRRVYFEAPSSSKADPSVVAVAQLLEEMGRHFEDQSLLHAAIREYEFLRQQYPGSKARFGALFRIGEIYRDDLHDGQHADEVLQEFVRRYPRNQFAEEARKALLEPVRRNVPTPDIKANLGGQVGSRDEHAVESPQAVEPAALVDKAAGINPQNATPSARPTLARVTGIRHWSTPGSSHVAIDLQHDVKYDSSRLAHPERIFFDLHDTKLDASLKGKILELNESLVTRVRVSQFKPRQTRVVLELGQAADFQASLLPNPPRLVIDVRSGQTMTTKAAPASDVLNQDYLPAGALSPELPDFAGDHDLDLSSLNEPLKPETSISIPKLTPCSDDKTTRNVTSITSIKKTSVNGGDVPSQAATLKRASPDGQQTNQSASQPAATAVAGSKGKRKLSTENEDAREAQPTAAGDRSLIRALGLKIGKIVIDPGHGGHDTGTIGPHGLEEKELVLDVSKRLGKLLASRLGAQVVYTRNDDTFVPLETRTAIANQEAADLFVSIHANSSRDADARGVETYYLNFSSSPEALEVAARENAVSEESIHELQDLVKKIALKEKIEESREFAVDVERSLHSGLAARSSGVRDRGVKKAPFIVLIGANMPSILAEISFLSNPGDERKLKTNDYRQRIAESLYRGIAKYVNGLSGVRVASKIDKDQ